MELLRYGRDVRTIFDLFGSKENDMTFSLGWILSRSEVLLRLLIAEVCGEAPEFIGHAVYASNRNAAWTGSPTLR